MKIKFLGTGTSTGIPVIACHCPTCMSSDPRDRRLRASIHIQEKGKSIIVDTGPDFRMQVLDNHIEKLDAVIYTHDHADHLHGIDDIRPFTLNSGKHMEVYGNRDTMDAIRNRFGYVVLNYDTGGGLPHLNLHDVDDYSTFHIGDIPVTMVPINHGRKIIAAYRIGDLAYVTDCSFISEKSIQALGKVKVLIVGALRETYHPTHFAFYQAIQLGRRLGAERTYFTHICHDVCHKDGESLPEGFELAYDGLEIEL